MCVCVCVCVCVRACVCVCVRVRACAVSCQSTGTTNVSHCPPMQCNLMCPSCFFFIDPSPLEKSLLHVYGCIYE